MSEIPPPLSRHSRPDLGQLPHPGKHLFNIAFTFYVKIVGLCTTVMIYTDLLSFIHQSIKIACFISLQWWSLKILFYRQLCETKKNSLFYFSIVIYYNKTKFKLTSIIKHQIQVEIKFDIFVNFCKNVTDWRKL